MTIYDVALVPLVMGVVQVAKTLGLSNRFAPLLSVFLGVIIGVATSPNDLLKGIIVGIAVGLSAVGLYSGTKNTIEKE
ncbi:MAG: hypothetical protein GX366_07385 [Epulopiscium sp.]|nr:hypothetical protein [Candidatus Epulonipiscium sp.]